jgi:hypothetical protein
MDEEIRVSASPIGKWNRLHKQLGSSPIIFFLLGAGVLFFWLCATITQIQTSEYLAQGSSMLVSGVSWNVLQQPGLLITGQAPIALATSWLYAWIVELVTLIFGLALSVAIAKISAVNPALARLFAVVGGLLILLNGWADYSSSPGTGILVQGLIAVAIGGLVVVGLPLGIGLWEHAAQEF